MSYNLQQSTNTAGIGPSFRLQSQFPSNSGLPSVCAQATLATTLTTAAPCPVTHLCYERLVRRF